MSGMEIQQSKKKHHPIYDKVKQLPASLPFFKAVDVIKCKKI